MPKQLFLQLSLLFIVCVVCVWYGVREHVHTDACVWRWHSAFSTASHHVFCDTVSQWPRAHCGLTKLAGQQALEICLWGSKLRSSRWCSRHSGDRASSPAPRYFPVKTVTAGIQEGCNHVCLQSQAGIPLRCQAIWNYPFLFYTNLKKKPPVIIL